jgi:hypothetical protein
MAHTTGISRTHGILSADVYDRVYSAYEAPRWVSPVAQFRRGKGATNLL